MLQPSAGCLRLIPLLLLAAACSDPDGGPGRPPATPGDAAAPDTASPDAAPAAGCEPSCFVASSKVRETLATLPAGVEDLVAGNTAFATRLYGVLRRDQPRDNLFYSPHSISMALAMAYAGARGDTATQMASALSLGLAQDSHRAFNGLDQELARRAATTPGRQGDPFQLSVVNALWGRRGYDFLPPFLDVLAVNYGAGLRVLDFQANPDAARVTINKWVEDRTAARIKDLLPAGTIKPDTILVLTNAIYFKASWRSTFTAALTTPRPFTRLDGQTVNVPTMAQTGIFPYAETATAQVVALPYVGDQLSMVFVAPRPGQLATFEQALDGPTLDALLATAAPTDVALRLPRFQFDAQLSLNQALASLGMPAAFSDGADFSGMNGSGGLKITDVVHKAFVAVDEKGTEAAAATGVVIGPTSVPAPPKEVNLDRPFLFLVRDQPTGALLFVGLLGNPG